MKSIAINEKIIDENGLKSIKQTLNNLLKGLDVQFEVKSKKPVEIEIKGVDEEAAKNFLTQRLPVIPDKFEEGYETKGRLIDPRETGFGIFIDLGGVEGLLPLWKLKEMENLSVKKFSKKYGLIDGLPVEVHIVQGGEEIEVHLTEKEKERIKRRLMTGAILVIGCTRSKIKKALKLSNTSPYVKKVEKLGINEHSIIGKKETDPPGLLSELGPFLGDVTLHPVSK